MNPIPILVTQNVTVAEHGERRDALDHRWAHFLTICGLLPVLVPNHPESARRLRGAFPDAGLLLTGGNDLVPYGGGAPERDATEVLLLTASLNRRTPILGVCRGMQVLQHYYGVALSRVPGHVAVEHPIAFRGTQRVVNSFHHWAAYNSLGPLEVWGRAADGVVEAVGSRELRLAGIMWHPERMPVPDGRDMALFRNHLAGAACAR
ncbi:gamma-glutamyl-gamma-aminobutyrate hydrolase family protein [Nocardia carnea]|uniref:gamma-glutamyl-gamma-aminobutyrate hydrolase family protein n=1 Tax=Nocardia carnea TaxID=37328 RepID=UPI002455C63F|nr:gamma-glutamyl-gamma-aminobutyrate hydrolase family protein [Nocardia carnea]